MLEQDSCWRGLAFAPAVGPGFWSGQKSESQHTVITVLQLLCSYLRFLFYSSYLHIKGRSFLHFRELPCMYCSARERLALWLKWLAVPKGGVLFLQTTGPTSVIWERPLWWSFAGYFFYLLRCHFQCIYLVGLTETLLTLYVWGDLCEYIGKYPVWKGAWG